MYLIAGIIALIQVVTRTLISALCHKARRITSSIPTRRHEFVSAVDLRVCGGVVCGKSFLPCVYTRVDHRLYLTERALVFHEASKTIYNQPTTRTEMKHFGI